MADQTPTTIPAEEWRAVEGWPSYEVSSLGRVRSLERQKRPGKGGKYRPSCILKPYVNGNGYELVPLYRAPRKSAKAMRVHQLVCHAFRGPKPSPQHEVCHNDGVKRHNAEANLRWGTKADNKADSARHGTMRTPPGGRPTLREDQVVEIRRALTGGAAPVALAQQFSVSAKTIKGIAQGHTWRRLLPTTEQGKGL